MCHSWAEAGKNPCVLLQSLPPSFGKYEEAYVEMAEPQMKAAWITSYQIEESFPGESLGQPLIPPWPSPPHIYRASFMGIPSI